MIRNWLQRYNKVPSIFLCFLKIGPVTFGGGYAMIPLIEHEIVEKRKWIDTDEVADIFALAQSVPGAVAINAATFIGYRAAGVPGALAAILGVLLPTFAIVLLLSVLFLQAKDHPKVAAAFLGIRAAIVALICYAGIKIAKNAIQDKTTFLVLLCTLALLGLTAVHPALLIFGGFVLGITLVAVRGKLGLESAADTRLEDEEDWGYMMGDGI
jgi:chromate transporter